MPKQLPFKIYCKSLAPYYELIAAFDCESAAIAYAGECALANTRFSYRVMQGKKSLREFGP